MNIDINSLGNRIFNALTEYLNSELSSTINIPVRQYAIENNYPIVVFEENTNTDTSHTKDKYRMNSTRAVSYSISILAIDTPNMTSYDICDLVSSKIANFMENGLNMTGGIQGKFYNINNAKASKYVLRYNCTWDITNDTIC